MNQNMVAPVVKDEIRNALFDINPLKDPGPDGMSPKFFQYFWDVIKFDSRLLVCVLLVMRSSSVIVWHCRLSSDFTLFNI